jgi:hypothetical protein
MRIGASCANNVQDRLRGRYSVDRRVVWGSGTVVSRMAHRYNGHPTPFETCSRCHWGPAARFEPGASFGVLATDGPKVAGESEAIRRLLVP